LSNRGERKRHKETKCFVENRKEKNGTKLVLFAKEILFCIGELDSIENNRLFSDNFILETCEQ